MNRLATACLSALLAVSPASAGFFPDDPFSDKAAGTTGAAFLKIPSGARALALGSSSVAAVGSSEAIFLNPAGLARLEAEGRSEVGVSYNSLLAGTYSGTVSYARPFVGERGVFGTSLIYFSQSAIQGFDTLGNASGDFTPTDFALSGAYAKKLGNVLVGGSLKFIRSAIAEVSGTTFAMDLGVQVLRVSDVGDGALDLGASIQNFGPSIQTGSVSDPLPFKFQAGGMWHISPKVRGLLDGHVPIDDNPYASLGMEVLTPIAERLRASFRGGYNIRNGRDIDGLSGMSGGFGVEVQNFRLDYAWVPFGDLGQTHRISLGFLF